MRLGECVTGTDAAAESHVPKIQGGALRGENAFCLAGQSAQCHDTKMSEQLTLEKIRQLSVSERLRLIEDVWASLSETPERIEVPDWHRAQLDARLAAHERDPAAAQPWGDVKADILRNVRK
jgi:putative addiction module component (TIGR02574 family)